MVHMRKSPPPSLLDFSKYKETIDKRQKYVKNEFQSYGLDLAKELGDWQNRSLYLRLAKNTPREILEKARLFVKDQSPGSVKSPSRLFMWKLKQIKLEVDSKKG